MSPLFFCGGTAAALSQVVARHAEEAKGAGGTDRAPVVRAYLDDNFVVLPASVAGVAARHERIMQAAFRPLGCDLAPRKTRTLNETHDCVTICGPPAAACAAGEQPGLRIAADGSASVIGREVQPRLQAIGEMLQQLRALAQAEGSLGLDGAQVAILLLRWCAHSLG